MNNLNIMRGLQLVAGSTLLMFASLSHAQYVWIDAKGMKQYSDRPPPPSIPVKNILKAKGMPTASEPAPAPETGTAVAAKAPPASLADREADYRKRQTDKADADKKASVDAEHAKSKVAACTAARQIRGHLDSGVPIRDSDPERSFLDDKQIGERKAAANKTIAEHCG